MTGNLGTTGVIVNMQTADINFRGVPRKSPDALHKAPAHRPCAQRKFLENEVGSSCGT
jgi:hypothetical protein